MPKKPSNELGFNLVVNEVSRYENKRTGREDGSCLISIGPLPISFSKLAKPSTPTDEDKYTVVFTLTEAQRQFVIDQLAPVGVALAEIRGTSLTQKEAESILREKLKEIADLPGFYRMRIDQKVFFDREEGRHFVDMPVKGPDGEPLEKPYLTNGSEGYANFLLQLSFKPGSKKPSLPFRLQAVKVSKPVYYEFQDGPTHDDFSDVESAY